MQRIVIYVHNEEQEALKPLMNRLLKAGALVTCHALKYPDPVKADVVLTFKRYEAAVKKIFADTKVPVQLIEDADDDRLVRPQATKPAEAPVKSDPIVSSEVHQGDEAPIEVTVEEDEPIVLTVGEEVPVVAPPVEEVPAVTPPVEEAPSRARRRKE